jgi:hypothetical protein
VVLEKISWKDYERNEEVLHRVKKGRDIMKNKKEGRSTGLVITCIVPAAKTRY